MVTAQKEKKKEKVPSGWRTTDEDEMLRRRLRGQQDEMEIHPLEEEQELFGSYSVKTEKGITYVVEIRSLVDPMNSCGCPDFQVNTLGVCKHIEGVVHHIKKQAKQDVLSSERSEKAEIYLRQEAKPQVCIAWPQQQHRGEEIDSLLKPLFCADDTLSANPIVGMAAVHRALSQAPASLRNQIRVSHHITPWLDEYKSHQHHQRLCEQFLADVEEGKRSKQVLSTPLYPYQIEGMLYLAFKRRAVLADEMGLGKTIQAIAACELLRRLQGIQRVLVISPASLKGEWEEQIGKFTSLPTQIVGGAKHHRQQAYRQPAFFFLANYEQIRSDFDDIHTVLAPDIIILDEAQRIKNWQTQTAWSVKQLKVPYMFVLTGTPIENRIDELYSIMQVVEPKLFGPLFAFNREFYQLDPKGKPIGYKNLDELHRKIRPYVLRRLKNEVEEQLPERTIKTFFVPMTETQQDRYQDYHERVAKLLAILKKRELTQEESKKLQQYLACMRMIADTPYILDETCRDCPKLEELQEILVEMLENTTHKIIIFSEWERMLMLVRECAEEMDVSFAWHTGSVPQHRRREDIKRFKEDPACRLFLTTDSGSTGLNLQAASVVVNLDLPWNPAKLEQRIARAWRKHQTKVVQVINLVSEDTIEHRMLSLLSQKRVVANAVLDGVGEHKEVPLPSTQRDFMDRLEELTGDSFSTEEPTEGAPKVSPERSLEDLKNEAIAHFTDRIHYFAVHENEDTKNKTVFVVVDNHDFAIEEKMQSLTQDHFSDSSDRFALEVVDQKTFATLEKLMEMGVLSLNEEGRNLLYSSSDQQKTVAAERQRRLDQAKKTFSTAEHQMRMSSLLLSGGFIAEALEPAKKAYTLGMKCFSILKKRADERFLVVESHLDTDFTNRSKELNNVVENVEEMIAEVENCITKFSLSG